MAGDNYVEKRYIASLAESVCFLLTYLVFRVELNHHSKGKLGNAI